MVLPAVSVADDERQINISNTERPVPVNFHCNKDRGYSAIGAAHGIERASTSFVDDVFEKSQPLPAGYVSKFLLQHPLALPTMPSFSWLVVPKEARVGCCKPCRDHATRADCTVHFDGAKLLDELVEPVENYSSLVPMPSLCPYTDEDCLSDSGHACNLSDDECMHEVQTVDEPPRADDVAADKEELAITPVPYDEAKS